MHFYDSANFQYILFETFSEHSTKHSHMYVRIQRNSHETIVVAVVVVVVVAPTLSHCHECVVKRIGISANLDTRRPIRSLSDTIQVATASPGIVGRRRL